MDIYIGKYGPVLDVAMPVIKELSENGEANVIVPDRDQALGMLVDLNRLIVSLNNYVDTEVGVYLGRPIRLDGKKRDGEENKRLSFHIVKEEFTDTFDEQLFSSTIIDCNEPLDFRSKVSIQAKNNVQRDPSPRLVRILKERGFQLPEEVQKVRLELTFHGYSFFVQTYFQDFPESESFKKRQVDVSGYYYPVSSSKQHLLNPVPYQFIKDPIFWASWGWYQSVALNILSGCATLQEKVRYQSIPEETLQRHFENAKEGVWRLIDCDIGDRNPREAALSLGCPMEYVGLFLRNPLKTLRYFANPNTVDSPYVRNLVEAYNSARGKSITISQLCHATGKK